MIRKKKESPRTIKMDLQFVGIFLFVLGVLLYVTSTTVDMSTGADERTKATNAYNLSIAATVFMWCGATLVLVANRGRLLGFLRNPL